MTPEQIKRAKRLAEILGIKLNGNREYIDSEESIRYGIDVYESFNPEQDKALLWDLQNKYKAEITYDDGCVVVYYDEDVNYVERASSVFSSLDNLPAALIDCVIEINGGYNE